MKLSEQELNALLKAHAMKPPSGFTEHLMQNLEQELAVQELPEEKTAREIAMPVSQSSRGLEALRWLLLAAGGVLGIVQSGSFVMGMWVATAVG